MEKIIQEKNWFAEQISFRLGQILQNFNPKQIMDMIMALNLFVNNNNEQKEQVDLSGNSNKQSLETQGQIKFLQNKIQQNEIERRQLSFYSKRHMDNRTEENTLLINELNNLRVEKKTLLEIRNQLQSQLNLFIKKNQNLEASL